MRARRGSEAVSDLGVAGRASQPPDLLLAIYDLRTGPSKARLADRKLRAIRSCERLSARDKPKARREFWHSYEQWAARLPQSSGLEAASILTLGADGAIGGWQAALSRTIPEMRGAAMFQSTISAKGRATVPADVRARMGAKPGTRLSCSVLSDGTVVVRVKTRSILSLAGMLKAPDGTHLSIDELSR